MTMNDLFIAFLRFCPILLGAFITGLAYYLLYSPPPKAKDVKPQE